MAQRGKRYLEAAKAVDRTRLYTVEEAIAVVKQISYTRFDGTVEVHLRMGIDPRHSDQLVRGVALLPHGLGKPIRVLVFAQGEAAGIAEGAGADVVGSDDLIKKIEEGWLEFDVALSTPDMMGKVGRLGRIIGRRGLMPNPRTGTVVQPQDLPRAIQEAKRGRLEFRTDRTGLIHAPIGKVSFSDEALNQNLATFLDAVNRAKPSGAKGQYVRAIALSATMGPGINLDVNQALTLARSLAAA
ncbi:MAG: 50S ribosomal protein L1 [Chloroflexi bacterium]|nr:50S ribosomal protein L1 [Chloroflexota bacterium]